MPTITRRSLLMLTSVAAVLSAAPARATDKLRVVTTTTDLAAITRAVGGDRVDVTTIATGREDPHFIAAKPSYMMAARKADLWIRVGMELEIGYEPLILDGSRNPRIRVGTPGHLDASEGVLRLEVPTQKIDRSMGDVHPLGNPHYWTDPLNGRIVAKTIGKRLARLAPEHADYFTKRVKSFQQQLDERMFGREPVATIGGSKLWALLLKSELGELLSQPGQPTPGGWLAVMQPHAGKKLVTYHRSWSYFAHRFGLIVSDELEPKPGIPPSPAHVASVVNRVKREDIKVLLMEPFYSRKAPDLVASETGIAVVQCAISVGGQPEASDYLTMIDSVVNRVSTALHR
ncbi:MAG: zinc ABC transporter substrate-binding protein [Phycisphaerales bacterium]|nr:MAG: zinc ABC transporter substrate-binding protein [Phycisphaerales bacterium]